MSAQPTAIDITPQGAPWQNGQHLILRRVSWETYERLLADFQDGHAAHFADD